MHHIRYRNANAIDIIPKPKQPDPGDRDSFGSRYRRLDGGYGRAESGSSVLESGCHGYDREYRRSLLPLGEPHFAISYDLKSPEPFPDFTLSDRAWAIFTGFIVMQPRLEYYRSALRHNICDSDRKRYLAILAKKGTHQDIHDIFTNARFLGFQNESGPMPFELQDALANRFKGSFPAMLEMTQWLAMMTPVAGCGMLAGLAACGNDISALDFLGKDAPEPYQLVMMYAGVLLSAAVLEFFQTKRRLTQMAIEMLGCGYLTSKTARSLILEAVFLDGKPSMLPVVLAQEAQSYRTDPISG